MKILCSSLFVVVMLWSAENVQAQVPAKCFEIESILVDACISATECPGSQEGQNEMVRFRVGPDPIALADIVADWPNNTWRGLVQDVSTAALTATLNASIESCGWLVEPPAGVIPPGAGVLMITSTEMCVPANSFANLGDTLYIVFQSPGNLAGHFANHTNGGTISPTPTGTPAFRTLVMTHAPTNCGDTATYDRSLLTNIFGTYGGNSANNDGATAVFTWPGVPQVSYVNFGCQAPFVPVSVSVEVTGDLCGGGEVQLQGITSGSFDAVEWTGGSGSFSDANALLTSYTPGPGDVGSVTLSLCATGSCSDPVCTTVTLPVGDEPVVLITADAPLELCPGETLTLTASGADEYLWSTGSTNASIVVVQPGTFNVTGTNACGQASASVTVSLASSPSVSISGDPAPCTGTSTDLVASGPGPFVWSTGETGPSITVQTSGTYSVTTTNDCGTSEASLAVTFVPGPTVQVSSSGTLCPDAVLTATGAQSYVWSTGATTASITVTDPGTYTVVGTSACGTDTASITVEASDLSAGFQASVVIGAAPLPVQFTNLSEPPTATFEWDFGDGDTSTGTAPTHVYTEPGTYVVTLTATDGDCSASATVVINVVEPSNEPSSVRVPNVFSPNGDGQNDTFEVITTGIARLEMQVFNRWGQEVATLERANQKWDGRSAAGELLSEGTYFYVLDAEGADGKRYDLTGTITLLR
jgi:gliding motility-associated-like protein